MTKLLRWIPAVIWMAVIFYLSHQEATEYTTVLSWFQKLIPRMESFNWGHFVAYFILALCIHFALGAKFNHVKGKILVIILCTLYGVTDEYHQTFIEGRHADIVDIRNDCIGAALAMIVISIPPFKRLYMRFL